MAIKILIFLFLTFNLFSSEMTGRVIKVLDGDTIAILYDFNEYRVRLEHIDAPEKTQDYGQKSKQFLSDLIFDKEVTCVYKNKDRYGRIIGEIYLNKTFINKKMIENGFAWWYKKYSKNKELGELQEKAKQKKLGLWEGKEPLEPELYRRKK